MLNSAFSRAGIRAVLGLLLAGCVCDMASAQNFIGPPGTNKCVVVTTPPGNMLRFVPDNCTNVPGTLRVSFPFQNRARLFIVGYGCLESYNGQVRSAGCGDWRTIWVRDNSLASSGVRRFVDQNNLCLARGSVNGQPMLTLASCQAPTAHWSYNKYPDRPKLHRRTTSSSPHCARPCRSPPPDAHGDDLA